MARSGQEHGRVSFDSSSRPAAARYEPWTSALRPNTRDSVRLPICSRMRRARCGLRLRAVCIADGATAARRGTTRDGLPGDDVWDLFQDRRGRLWAATHRGASFGCARGRTARPRSLTPSSAIGTETSTVCRRRGCFSCSRRPTAGSGWPPREGSQNSLTLAIHTIASVRTRNATG